MSDGMTMKQWQMREIVDERDRLRAENARLREALMAINDWCGTYDGYQALPFEPPWAQQMYDALGYEDYEPAHTPENGYEQPD
jgi:hypothetical protein